jgi:cytochrome c oxidase subunit 2
MNIDTQRRQWLLAGGAVALGTIAAAVHAQAAERVIPVVARKFVFVPNEIRLKKGETVVLELSAPEVLMGFACHDLGLRTDIVPGRVTRLRVTPDKAGSFAFLCDVFCGSGHEDMQGMFVVTA